MTLQQLLYFCEIVEKKNYTKAAQELYVTQSSLSHAMADLETELGVTLLYRNEAKETEPTKYGQVLFGYARDIIDHMRYAREAIEAMGQEGAKCVRILSSAVSGVSFVFDIFKDFDQETDHKEIKLSFETVAFGGIVAEKLKREMADFMISGANYTEEDIISEPIGQQQMYVMVSAHGPLAKKEFLTVEDIRNKPVLHCKQHLTIQRYIEALFGGHNLKPMFVFSEDSWDVLATNVALGQGIMITPRLFDAENKVKYIPIRDPMSHREVYISYLASREMSEEARIVLNYCRTHRRFYT